jgi:hypothetical protein
MYRLLAPVIGRKQPDERIDVMRVQRLVHLIEHGLPLALGR